MYYTTPYPQRQTVITLITMLICICFIKVNTKAQILTNGTEYTILNERTYGTLDVKGGSSSAGTQVQTYDLNFSNAQKFTFENAGNGLFYIKTKANLYLSIKYYLATATSPPPTGSNNGNWILIQDVKYQKSQIPSPLKPDPTHQMWELIPVTNQPSDESPFYYIRSAAFQHREVLQTLTNQSKSPIVVAQENGDFRQKWVIYKSRKPNERQQTSSGHQWKVSSFANRNGVPLYSGEHYNLFNVQKQKYISYKQKTSGIDLDWYNSPTVNYIQIDNHPNIQFSEHRVLRYGDKVTVVVGGNHDPSLVWKNNNGVDLDWAKYDWNHPAHEWKIGGNKLGELVLVGDIFSLENTKVNDILVLCSHQSTGIDIEWDNQCAPPQPPGYSKIALYNCHSEKRNVRVWTKDITTSSGTWVDRGNLPSQWTSGGACPGNALPMNITLIDNHNYILIAIDGNCSGNPDKAFSSCQKLRTGVIHGKTGGLSLPLTIN